MNQLSENTFQKDFLNAEGGKSKSNAIEIPTISLSKDSRVIKSIDEIFLVNADNGSLSFSIPLSFSETRAINFSPHLACSPGEGNRIFVLSNRLRLVEWGYDAGMQITGFDLEDYFEIKEGARLQNFKNVSHIDFADFNRGMLDLNVEDKPEPEILVENPKKNFK